MSDTPAIREDMISSGTSWLLEMELLDTPQIKNLLYLNTYNASPHIRDVELLLDTGFRIMLVWIELGWWGRALGKQKELEEYLLDQYQKILPSFRVRVVFDRRIFDLSLQKAEALVKGGTSDAKVNPSSSLGVSSRPLKEQQVSASSDTSTGSSVQSIADSGNHGVSAAGTEKVPGGVPGVGSSD